MKRCFICGSEIVIEEKINVVHCKCPKCGEYAYEKNFLTAFDYYFSQNGNENRIKMQKFLKKYVKKHHVCFVDDYETSLVEGYDLKEFRDILNMIGLEITHNNTIDSNWTD